MPGNVNPDPVEDDQNDPPRQRFAAPQIGMKDVLGLIAGNAFPRRYAKQEAGHPESQQSEQPNQPAEVPAHSSILQRRRTVSERLLRLLLRGSRQRRTRIASI